MQRVECMLGITSVEAGQSMQLVEVWESKRCWKSERKLREGVRWFASSLANEELGCEGAINAQNLTFL
jgi:hypothetical protein